MICRLFGAQAITIGSTIFISKKSWAMSYPAGCPVRLALLVHEVFHIKQESEKWLPCYMFQYLVIEACLVFRAIITKHWLTPAKLAHFLGKHHPYERPAYKLQAEFLEKYWTIEEAEKWKGVMPK